MGFVIIGFFIVLVAVGLFVQFHLGGEDLSRWDSPPHETNFTAPPSDGQKCQTR